MPPLQRGAALLMIMVILGVFAAYFAISALNRTHFNERNRVNTAALSQARDALLGFAAAYRDFGHPNEVYGYLPCPDLDNNGAGGIGGVASTSPVCPNKDISTAGRVPWYTLGMPPLRDKAGECLWYAASGTVKDVNKTDILNWDTLGQFIIQDASGTVLAGGASGAAAHQRPFAVVIAPGAALGAQSRTASVSECGGSTVLASYLEGVALPWPAVAKAPTTITVAIPTSINNGSNNDQAVWITPKDIFDRVKMTRQFKSDIDVMLDDIAACLGTIATISPASPTHKGIDNVINDYNANCPNTAVQTNIINNWRDNLLYAHPLTESKVTYSNGTTDEHCTAVLLFGGERTGAQIRDTQTNQDNATMYLEGSNATLFPNAGTYSGMSRFNGRNASADLLRCIKAAPPTKLSFSNASDFASFTPKGVGVTTDTTTPGDPKVIFNNAAGSNGGCFWNPNVQQLAGKTIRAYYEFIFGWPDPPGGADRGNGFTFQMVEGDMPPPPNCGTQADMGALSYTDPRGVTSLLIETDVHQDAANNDSVENHTAIMFGGNMIHSGTNGTLTTACDGSSSGCIHAPANRFEESPTPLLHNQRIEIHTGCDAGCAHCNASTPAGSNTSITVWVDCSDCSDLRSDADRSATPPTIQRCIDLTTVMNTFYFGLTAGFRSGTSLQGVTVSKLNISSE